MNRMKDHLTQSVVEQLLSRLKADSRSASEIARLADVSQPTISRLRKLSGRRYRSSIPFNKLCNFYGLPTPNKTGDGYTELLRNAIIDVWDGTDAGGQALLTILEGLKELNKKPIDLAGDSRDHT
jgi:transcriptional regulator with XRE-family HTH domain